METSNRSLSYLPIDLDPCNVPEPIRAFVAGMVEPYLMDVREMLRHPRAHNLPAMNFSIASVLCSVIGGLSRVFYNGITGDGASFKAVAARYPMADEPANAVRDPASFAEFLYTAYRCNLVHSLGLNMGRDKNTDPWEIRPRTERIKVARRPGLPLDDAQLAEMDRPTGWPSGLPATLALDTQKGEWRLDADALYCGVRRLVRLLAEDSALQAGAVGALKPWFDSITGPPVPSPATLSGATPTIHYSHAGVDASANAVTAVIHSFWEKPKDGEK